MKFLVYICPMELAKYILDTSSESREVPSHVQ